MKHVTPIKSLFAVAFAFAMSAGLTAEARSITSVERIAAAGTMSLNVTFEAGEPGDEHALYIAYDTEDKGPNIANWAALQRGCVVADDATSATIPVSPLLTSAGYTFCRVFLTTSTVPYDTLIESLRQTGTQYIDTGIKPNQTTIVSLDFQFSDASTTQQRVFGVSSDSGKDYATFSFDAYINGSGYWASACQDGGGDFLASTLKASTDRLTITLDANTGDHTVSNHVSGVVTTTTRTTTRSTTSKGNMPIFAHHKYYYESKKEKNDYRNIAKGGHIYSGTITTNGAPARIYQPCTLGGRAGLYDEVSGQISYSAVATDFEKGSDPVACSLLVGETQVAASPVAIGLFFDYTWRGTAVNWSDTDAWTKDGDPATWVAGNNAIFETANATVTLAANAVANSIAFNADTTIATNGTDVATLAVKSIAVDTGVSATIAAPTSVAFEKTGLGTLTLTEDRADATTVTAGTLKMDGATVAGLTLGTDGGAPVTFDYGGQTLEKNPQTYLVTGSTVTLTNGIFATQADFDLNLRDDIAGCVFPSVLTIAKDATLGKTTTSKKVYICKDGSGSSTINVAGGSFEITGGSEASYIQHKSVSGRVNINVTDGGLLSFPGVVYALCRGDINVTSPSLYMTFSGSTFNAGGNFYFENSFTDGNYFNVPTTPTGVFAATNSVVSVGDGFFVGRNKQDEKSGGSLTVDFEGSTVTAKTFAVYYDRPLNNARFNNTRFVFNAESGSIAASDGEANWITVGANGLTLDTQEYSATLNANLGGSGAVTKVGAGTLTVARNQASTGGFTVSEGTLAVNGGVSVSRPIAVASVATLAVNATGTARVDSLALTDGSTLNITSYTGTTPLSIGLLTLPESGTANLTLNGGAFAKGIYAIYSKSGVTAADGAKFAFTTTDGLLGSWSVADGTLLLTVGDLSGNYWIGRGGDGRMSTAANWLNGVPAAGADIDLSFVSSGTTLIADAERTFGAVTMGDGVITFTNAMAATSFSDLSKIAVAVDSTVTIAGDVTITESSQKLCNTIAAGGKLRITGLLEIKHSSGTFTFLSNWGAGAVVAEGGISVNTTEIATMNAKALVLGENGLTFAKNGEFRFKAQGQGDDKEKPVVYALGATTVIGSGASKGKLRGDYAPFTFRTTQFESNLPATITFNSSIDGATNWNAQWAVDGCGRVVCTSTSKADRGVRVKNGATLSLNPGFSITSQTDQNFYVNSGATLEVAASGTVSFYGKSFNLLDGSTLAFNFTERETAPVLALANIAAPTISGAVKVKVSGSVWPKSGEYQLTTCGGFGAEGVTVSLAAGAPKWVTGLTVNGDGNIVLSVKPMGTIFIVR